MVLKMLFVLCIIIEIIFVPLFLKAQWPGICRKSLFFKMICATAFVCAGVLCMNIAGNKSVYAIMMLVGLCPAPEPHQKSADLRADLFHHSWFLQGTSPLLRFSRLFALFQVLS